VSIGVVILVLREGAWVRRMCNMNLEITKTHDHIFPHFKEITLLKRNYLYNDYVYT